MLSLLHLNNFTYEKKKKKSLSLFPRNTKLWICMEYCGGGSLQDIYHGTVWLLQTSQIPQCTLLSLDSIFTVTGPLKEKQIAYICRETLQVKLFFFILHITQVIMEKCCLQLCENHYAFFHWITFHFDALGFRHIIQLVYAVTTVPG